jgi:hypothetical protein
MFKSLSAAAMVAAFAAPALAQPVVVAGQYIGTTQYTGTIDPSGTCSGLGVVPGLTTSSVATVGGLGKAFTSTIANPGNGSSANPYQIDFINCAFPKLPPASAFVASSIGGATGPAETIYTAVYPVPKGKAQVAQTTTNCAAASTQAGLNGLANYALISGNGTDVNGTPQTLTTTVIPVNPTGLDYGWKLTSTNSQLNVGGTLVCYLSTDAVYLSTNK